MSLHNIALRQAAWEASDNVRYMLAQYEVGKVSREELVEEWKVRRDLWARWIGVFKS